MVDFVNDNSEFRALQRFGGNIDLLKRFISAGFPVLIEKGYYERDYTGKITWMGHYLFVTGYDDTQSGFIVQDAYLIPGQNLLSKYDIFEEGWRGFNYLFMIVYPPNREQEAYRLLGDWGDPKWASQHALDIANEEVKTVTGIDAFFAWFNKGTSHIQLDQNEASAEAFDQAFKIYATLGKDEKQRPYRMMWYQTWPYFAYYRTGRYQDVIDLANATFKTIDKPTLEESLYWRGMAELALGNTASAIQDFRDSVYYNPNFGPGLTQLNSLGVKP
jgi:tetratricopeptide (TPR) repeat protein